MRMRIRDLFDPGSGMKNLDKGWKNLDPGSGISIPYLQHWYLFFLELAKSDKTRLMQIRVRLARCKTSSNESVHLAGSNNFRPIKNSKKIYLYENAYLRHFPKVQFYGFLIWLDSHFFMWILLCSPYFIILCVTKTIPPVCKLWPKPLRSTLFGIMQKMVGWGGGGGGRGV
jgi:hypothetical protein